MLSLNDCQFVERNVGLSPTTRKWSEHWSRVPRSQVIIAVAIGVGGSVGAVARYMVAQALPSPSGTFPWGTLVINLTGSVVLGFLLVVVMEKFPRGRLARPVLATGIIGAYTTFSTFEVETLLLLRGHHVTIALAYQVASVVAGITLAALGASFARLTIRLEGYLQRTSA
jgi:CrcB protein